MDVDATPDQRLLLDASKRFIEKECPLPAVRDRLFENEEFAAVYRHQAGELGWYSLLVPEEMGGGAVSGNRVVGAAAAGTNEVQTTPFSKVLRKGQVWNSRVG